MLCNTKNLNLLPKIIDNYKLFILLSLRKNITLLNLENSSINFFELFNFNKEIVKIHNLDVLIIP